MFWTSPTPAYQKEESEAGAQQQKFTMGLHITESEGVNKRQAGMGDCWGLLPPLGLRGQRQDEVSSGLKSQVVRWQLGWWRLPGWGGTGEGETGPARDAGPRTGRARITLAGLHLPAARPQPMPPEASSQGAASLGSGSHSRLIYEQCPH